MWPRRSFFFIFTCDTKLIGDLTHWGRVTHICVSKLTIIGSDNGLSPERRQAIIWTNAGILLIGPLGTNFDEILIEIQTFSLKKICLKMSSAKCCSFRLGLNVLNVVISLPVGALLPGPRWMSEHQQRRAWLYMLPPLLPCLCAIPGKIVLCWRI